MSAFVSGKDRLRELADGRASTTCLLVLRVVFDDVVHVGSRAVTGSRAGSDAAHNAAGAGGGCRVDALPSAAFGHLFVRETVDNGCAGPNGRVRLGARAVAARRQRARAALRRLHAEPESVGGRRRLRTARAAASRRANAARTRASRTGQTRDAIERLDQRDRLVAGRNHAGRNRRIRIVRRSAIAGAGAIIVVVRRLVSLRELRTGEQNANNALAISCGATDGRQAEGRGK